MQHPVTTEYKNTKKNILQTIKAVHLLKKPTVWFWPNIDAGSDDISKGIICLPLYPELKTKEVKYICSKIKNILNKI